MRSTFMGLETARRGMFTQQSALQTTGNNIANANTTGYTRQRVNFQSTEAYPSLGLNRPQLPGQLGTGVEAGSVQRVRESFLDMQYRQENNKLGYWDSRANALEKMEEIMNEPSDTGLSITLDRFWKSLQDLALDPTNAGARSVVRERGSAVANTFNYLSTSLLSVQGDLKSELEVSIKEINSIANQLNSINKQISEIEPHGYLPNDLYDERDLLLDQLSSLANIKVTSHKPGGNAIEIAEGTFTVEFVDDNGKSLVTLVDAKQQKVNTLSVQYNQSNGLVENVSVGSKDLKVLNFNSLGEISSLIHSHGYTYTSNDTTFEKGLYLDMLESLDTLAYKFADKFNEVHRTGWSLSNFNSDFEADQHTEINFFSFGTNTDGIDVYLTDENLKGAASSIQISTAIKSSTDNIASAYQEPGQDASTVQMGDGNNAIKLSEVKNQSFSIGGNSTTFQNYYEGIIGGMAINTQEAERLTTNSNILRDSVDQRRQSVSTVSLDEEMTNMIQFQHAYNASAKMISLQDELLDTIINRMKI